MAIQTCLYVVSWALHAKMSLSSKHYYARQKRPLLVHCASGNRVGGLLALMQARSGTMTTEQALEFGRSAGMGSTEARVRTLLDAGE